MAGSSLPVNVDSTYADSGSDPTVQLHQQHHDAIHKIVNLFDKDATASQGQTWMWDSASSLYLPQGVVVNAQSGTTYTLVLSDAFKQVQFSNAGGITLTIPTNASVAFPLNTIIMGLQLGAGQVTIAVAGGVTCTARGITPPIKAAGQYAPFTLQKTGTDVWIASGDISA